MIAAVRRVIRGPQVASASNGGGSSSGRTSVRSLLSRSDVAAPLRSPLRMFARVPPPVLSVPFTASVTSAISLRRSKPLRISLSAQIVVVEQVLADERLGVQVLELEVLELRAQLGADVLLRAVGELAHLADEAA